MRFGLGVLCGFLSGLMAAAVLYAKTERAFETGTYYKLQICKAERDELINGVRQYERAIQEIPQLAEIVKANQVGSQR